jgi:hypothetical protein
MASARRHGLNQLLFETETELDLLRQTTVRSLPVRPVPPVGDGIIRIAEAVREMREAIGVG